MGLIPVWSWSVRMSGVFGHAFGRKKSTTGGLDSSRKYSSISQRARRQAK
jgi:hypothetical protein